MKKIKSIGDSTSITIPRRFTNYLTGEDKTVSSEELELINEAIEKRHFVHLVMTGIEMVYRQKEEGINFTVTKKVDEIVESIRNIEVLLSQQREEVS
jgi:hypothetical protein